MKQTTNKLLNGNSEAGFTLLSLLIILSVTLALIVLGSRSTVQMRQASKVIKSVASYEHTTTRFTQLINQTLQYHASAICSNQLAPLDDLNFLGSRTRYRQNLDLPIIPATTEPTTRCKKPQFHSNGKFYFCLQLEANSSVPQDSFGGASFNFAEVAIRMVDKWQRDITCQQYISSDKSSVGLEIYYRLYWITKAHPERLLQKSGYYYGIE